MKYTVSRYESGATRTVKYFRDGLLHREDGPAYIGYYESGEIEYEGYRIAGEHHRVGGPARIGYLKTGEKRYEEYYVSGDFHRLDGPAYIGHKDYLSHPRVEEYYIDGRRLSLDDHRMIVAEIKKMDEGTKLIDPRRWVRELA